MAYLLNTHEDQQAMLEAIGAASIDELFASIPKELRLQGQLDLPPALTELELAAHLKERADQNASAVNATCFLGGGSYDHFIPAVVDAIASRGEFFTSYTPYQPEASQGNLQALFEYQTLITQLTGMDVANASHYDGATAAAEAVIMALAATGRKGRVLTAGSVHPEYRQVVATYLEHLDAELETLDTPSGALDAKALAGTIDRDTACVLVQHPNFFGCLEDVEALTAAAHDVGALMILVFDPLSLGLLKRPGDLGVDIAVAEGQSLGNAMAYGGPYLGILACRESLVRKMPGRLAGETVDRRGNRCFVLTLQTREQHIRREKATSNICTNQGLLALRAAIYLALVGPQGLREVATLCVQKTAYAAQRITAAARFTRAFDRPVFKEFVVRDRDGRVSELIQESASQGVLAGVPLAGWFDDLSDCFLVAVTEKRTRDEIDGLAKCLASANTEVSTTHA